jgi:hypothetical protein
MKQEAASCVSDVSPPRLASLELGYGLSLTPLQAYKQQTGRTFIMMISAAP